MWEEDEFGGGGDPEDFNICCRSWYPFEEFVELVEIFDIEPEIGFPFILVTLW